MVIKQTTKQIVPCFSSIQDFVITYHFYYVEVKTINQLFKAIKNILKYRVLKLK
jgi:hypothetical protein